MKNSPWIETFTGKEFHFLNPSSDSINIEDIAHALSNQCRFTGHTRDFYSIAEHSVYVSRLVPNRLRMVALLHDASEAYLTDVASPIKPHLANYYELEDNLMAAISAKFNTEYPLPKEVKDADLAQFWAEARVLIRSRGKEFTVPAPAFEGLAPSCYYPSEAKDLFLDRYYEIMEEGNA